MSIPLIRRFFVDEYGLTIRAIVVLIITVLCTILGAGIPGLNVISRHYSESNCESYARQVDGTAKFISTTWWSYDCYVDTDEGRVPIGQVVKVND